MKILKDFDILCYLKNFTSTPFCVHVHLELLPFGTCSLKLYLQEQMGKSTHSLQSFRFRRLKIESKVLLKFVSSKSQQELANCKSPGLFCPQAYVSAYYVNRCASTNFSFQSLAIALFSTTSISKNLYSTGKYKSSFIQSLKKICTHSLLSPNNQILHYTLICYLTVV